MSVYKFSDSSVKTKRSYPSFLAGNEAFSPNDFDSIATTTLSTATSSITFSSIPANYTHLQIRGISRSTTSGNGSDGLYMQINTDTGTNYSYHYLTGTGASAVVEGQADKAFMLAGFCPRAAQLANCFGVNVIDILDYANTNKNKTIRVLTGVETNFDASFPGYASLFSGAWRNTAAITSIKLYSEANNLTQYSSFALYGIKV